MHTLSLPSVIAFKPHVTTRHLKVHCNFCSVIMYSLSFFIVLSVILSSLFKKLYNCLLFFSEFCLPDQIHFLSQSSKQLKPCHPSCQNYFTFCWYVPVVQCDLLIPVGNGRQSTPFARPFPLGWLHGHTQFFSPANGTSDLRRQWPQCPLPFVGHEPAERPLSWTIGRLDHRSHCQCSGASGHLCIICIYSVGILQKSILYKAVPFMVSLEEGVGISEINAVIKFILLLLIKLCRQGEDINKYRVSDIGW